MELKLTFPDENLWHFPSVTVVHILKMRWHFWHQPCLKMFQKNHMFWQTSLRVAIQMYPNSVNLQVYYKCAQAAISTDGNWQETGRDAAFAYFPYFWNYIFAYLPYFWIWIFTIFLNLYIYHIFNWILQIAVLANPIFRRYFCRMSQKRLQHRTHFLLYKFDRLKEKLTCEAHDS